MEEVLTDALGFAGAVIIRRILGIAHVIDFETIKDQDIRCSSCHLKSSPLRHEKTRLIMIMMIDDRCRHAGILFFLQALAVPGLLGHSQCFLAPINWFVSIPRAIALWQ